jgi:DNA-binding HxlR family transcriptional regulator
MSIESVLGLISSKWRISLVCILSEEGTIRFNELKRRLPGISQRVLTAQLRAMEEVGLVERKTYGEVPPRVEYTITESGQALESIIVAVYDWSQKYTRGLVITAKKSPVKADRK